MEEKEKTSKFKQEQHIVSEQASLRCKKNIRKFEYWVENYYIDFF